MALDPIIKQIIHEYGKLQLPSISTLTPDEARQQLLSIYKPDEFQIPLAKIQGYKVPGPERDIPIRIYWPSEESHAPALLYFHAGGFVIGSLNTCDIRCQLLAYYTGCVIISVDYALAPENPFPAAVEEGYAVLQWMHDHFSEFGLDFDRIGVCGENSGGTIAASLCLMARDRQGPPIRYQLLLYPLLDNRLDTLSHEKFGKDYLLTQDIITWYWKHYLSRPDDAKNPYAVPARAEDLSHLPPAQIISAEFDPLRDEARNYANRLRDSGVPVHHHCYAGLIHGFLNMYGSATKVELVLADVGEKARAVMGVV